MNQLRQLMLEELQRRNFAATTIRTYLHGVAHFSRYFRRPPDQLGPEDIRKYQAMLFTKLKYSPNTVILRLASLRFFYIHVLKRSWSIAETPYPKKVRHLPGVLSQEEVARLIEAADTPFHRILLMTMYATRAARKAIDDSFSRALSRCYYWLDLGNNAASGQFVLGQPLNARNRRKADRLRTASELFPEIIDAEAGEDPLPSCSAVEALDRQEPFINQTLASSALAMMAQLFRYGKLAYHGAFFNAKSGKMSALPVDPDLWSRMRRRSKRAGPRTVKPF